MDLRDLGPPHPPCTCDGDEWTGHFPNGGDPCEWYFVFEPLVETRHWKRIRALDIQFRDFKDSALSGKGRVRLASGRRRFFSLPPLQLTSLKWTYREIQYADHLFSFPTFLPTLRFLSFKGYRNGQLTKVNNLTSFVFKHYLNEVDAETFRKFMLNNQSLETLSLKRVRFKGDSVIRIGLLSISRTSSRLVSTFPEVPFQPFFAARPYGAFLHF